MTTLGLETKLRDIDRQYERLGDVEDEIRAVLAASGRPTLFASYDRERGRHESETARTSYQEGFRDGAATH